MTRLVSWGRRGAFLVLRQKGGDFTKLSGVAIRPALPEDAAALLDIYAPYVRETAITFEYEVPSPEEFRGRVEAVLHTYPYLVAEAEGKSPGTLMPLPLRAGPLTLTRRKAASISGGTDGAWVSAGACMGRWRPSPWRRTSSI